MKGFNLINDTERYPFLKVLTDKQITAYSQNTVDYRRGYKVFITNLNFYLNDLIQVNSLVKIL